MTTFLLDTDIGTDVDDALALCFMLEKKSKRLLGVITTNGPTKTRAQIAKTILGLKGFLRIPVFRGQSTARTNGITPFVTGNESIGIESQSHAFPLRSILPLILSEPDGSIVYILIAPASTCSALLEIPMIRKKIKSVVIMGGVIASDPTKPKQEHNIAADPASFSRICAFRIPVFLVPLNLTLPHVFPERAIEEISRSGLPLASKMHLWIKLWRSFTLTFGEKDHWFKNRVLLHDPITCIAAMRKSAFRWQDMAVTTTQEGELKIGKGGTVRIATAIKRGEIAKLISQVVSSIVTHKNMV